VGRRGRVRRGRRRNSSWIVWLFLISFVVGIGAFIYFSPQFERVKPKIIVADKIYANSKTPIKFNIEDNVKLKSAKVTVSNGVLEIPVYAENFLLPEAQKSIEIKLPKSVIDQNSKFWDINIVVEDSSFWGLLGNKAKKTVKLVIDNTPPQISIISKSPSIRKGGTALIIYKVRDNSLKETFVQVGNLKFKPINYKKDDIFATLFVWPFNLDNFNSYIVAVDNAGNMNKIRININKLFKKYKVSKIKATDRFINGKISELASSDSDYANIEDKIEKFRAVNELMREKNEALIHKLSKKVTPFKGNWQIKPFKPLRGAKLVADFGTKRFYYYKDKDNIISTSYHLGYDWASVKHDDIFCSNNGIVVYSEHNGIYGNMPLIDHGFGLYTLYGHCSNVLVQDGQFVKAGEIIAKTGMTGLALGDHLHFGILVQGVEVLPLEWTKKNWISQNILDIFEKADKIISNK
jgi:murein DD-endopeptidase MepM/ murein hydrolase activator NlpD